MNAYHTCIDIRDIVQPNQLVLLARILSQPVAGFDTVRSLKETEDGVALGDGRQFALPVPARRRRWQVVRIAICGCSEGRISFLVTKLKLLQLRVIGSQLSNQLLGTVLVYRKLSNGKVDF